MLPLLAFGTPVGVFLLIGIGIIVIEYFLPSAQQEAPLAPPPVASAPLENGQPDTPALRAPDPVPAAQKPPLEPDPYLAGLDKKQVELRIRRTELLLQYTRRHPDVVQIDRQLEQLRIERRKYLRQQQKS